MTNKNLLPDNVNNAEEYLEYLHAIGHFEYVNRLEKLKEQMIFLLEHEFKSAFLDGQLQINIDAKEWFDKTFGGNNKQKVISETASTNTAQGYWVKDLKIQGGNK